MYIDGDFHSGLAYCKKCGYNKKVMYLKREKCPVCHSYVEPVPDKYIDQYDLFPDDETEELFIE